MEWTTHTMTDEHAIEILGWKYEKPYDFYNNVLSGEAIIDMTKDTYKAIVADDEVIGFYCVGEDAQVPAGHQVMAYKETCMDIGLGMRPDLTGKGLGTAFFQYILQDISKVYKGKLRLTVADFNKRAIHLYEKFYFMKKTEFWRDDLKFIVLVKED